MSKKYKTDEQRTKEAKVFLIVMLSLCVVGSVMGFVGLVFALAQMVAR